MKMTTIAFINSPWGFVQVPQQDDGSACGFWTIHFGKEFMGQPEYYRELIGGKAVYDAAECWHKEVGANMRRMLREYVEEKLQ
jgi:Ulp1 family protease